MSIQANNERIKVLLFNSAGEISDKHVHLLQVLKKAGLEVIDFSMEKNSHENSFWEQELQNRLEKTNCSVHILGNQYSQKNEQPDDISSSEMQFNEVQQHSMHRNRNYKIFFWHPATSFKDLLDKKQERFVSTIRNSLLHNIIISNHESPIVLAEDISLIMNPLVHTDVKTSQTELFFIYNELDEEDALEKIELLDDVLQTVQLKISQNSSTDYTLFLVEQIKHSKLAVVYFKWTADWAIPFVQQLWKLTGGASSQTEILLIGDSNIEYNRNKSFAAPKVTSLQVADELITLETKVHFDKIINNTLIV